MNDLAFIFPGQGSQSVAMAQDLFEAHEVVRDTFAEANDALSFDLGKLILEGPEQDLNRTDNTQPALLTVSVALFRLWQHLGGPLPSTMAGHSLGEYSALVCADALDFKQALTLVQSRGHFMQQAVPAGTGAMAAILGLENQRVEEICIEVSAETQVVAPVNYNSPGQLVIAGHKEAVEVAMIQCKEAGAKRALPLPVSVPSHCALMKPAAEQLAAALQQIDISGPKIRVINNVDVTMETSSSAISDALIRQLYKPVRWSETILLIQQQGISTVVECGAGKVLAGLCKRIDRSISALVTCDQKSFDKSLEALR